MTWNSANGSVPLLEGEISLNFSTPWVVINGSAAPVAVPVSSSDWWKERIQIHPDWAELWSQLSWTWTLHTFGTAVLFLVLACAAFFTILGLRAQLSARPHLSSLNVFLCLLGGSRALGLFIDPYGSKVSMPGVMSHILWDLAFPCLLSAFSLLQLAFLQMTQVKVAPSKLNSETCVSLVITSHFCLTIASDILWTLQNTLRIVWLLTQVMFSIWGIFLCLTFLCGCLRLLRSIAKLPLVFLSKVDSSSYENKGVLPLGMFARRSKTSSNGRTKAGNSSFAPKIRITDENDQTFSYVSDASQHNLTENTPGHVTSPNSPSLHHYQKNLVKSPHDHIRHPSNWHRKKPPSGDVVHINTASTSSHQIEDALQFQPLMSMRDAGRCDVVSSQIEETTMDQTATAVKANKLLQQSIRLNGQAIGDDFRFDAHKLKPSRRSRVEKLLRKMVLTALLGFILCLLQIYGVFGPHGLFCRQKKAQVIPWFCFQTICRLVEFSMGCTMANITRQSLHNHCHHSCSSGIKHRDSLFT
ncbi:uncharacterized protein LOC111626586 [Centruroides sculpturatus]|uniref:uncharacterized protein LOC111626586 n=1 Tax=Centruroides sculpturatus TaxID=218467 RepID=UPI000C6D844D|nr:uncharacterized protein LOC111626586 [Centruroides sculpturatus]XP_023225785.1 uncharacterized protein LOC111626586 [Centruroides sculpturatus]